MAPSLRILAAGATVLPAVLAQKCVERYPIYVDFHNRTVTGGGGSLQYGAFIGVGVPSQNQSIVPSFTRNETSFAARGFCDNSTISNCLNRTGGSVDFAASTNWTQTDIQSKDSTSPGNRSVRGTDDLHLWVHYFDPGPAISVKNVTATPVEYVTSGSTLPNIVGLGSASTLMQSLVDQELISARTFSLHYGDGMPRGGSGKANGSLTFGGYDSARMAGKVHTYPMDVASRDFMPVTVQDIVLDDPGNGTLRNVSIMEGGAFEARITTDQYPMRLPTAVTQRFTDLLGATSSNEADGSLYAPQFAGTMRIRLSDGFEITLNGSAVVIPSGLTVVQENTDDAGPFYLSIAWLTQVLLTLDYDAQQFHVSEAIQHDTYIVPRTLCAGAIPIAFNYGAKNSSFVKNGMVGVVIGAVVASLAAAVALLWTFVWWRRNRLAKKAWATQAALTHGEYKDGDASGNREMEMQDLSEAKSAPFAWIGKGNGKGKGVMAVPQDEDVADQLQRRSSSDEIGRAPRM